MWKSLLIVAICFALPNMGWSQFKKEEIDRHIEYGIGVGAMNYTGDLSQKLRAKFTRPAASLFYRHNFSNEISVLRFNLAVGGITAKEENVNLPLPQARQLEFSRTVIEVAAMYEYDFFDFRDLKSVFYMSPYLYGGIAASVMLRDRGVLSIPFGVGVKFKISESWNVGVEAGARKTFSDMIDGYADDTELSSSTKNDWYYYAGVTVSRTIYTLLCRED